MREAWEAKYAEYKKAYPELSAQYDRTTAMVMAEGWEKAIPVFPPEKPVATRNAGQVVMNAIAKVVPELFGGAADLTSSTKTIFKDSPSFTVDPTGRNVFFGVREFGMMAAVNGMAAHGGVIPFGSTFFTFSDYCRSALRMGGLMSCHSLYIFTHDTIGLGEDGPTHQPIEHLMSLRAIPQLTDFRPGDANETAACWRLALERKSASFMALSRQDLPTLDTTKIDVYGGCKKGAYVIDGSGKDIILIGVGSELSLVMEAAAKLKEEGIGATVISMPSFKILEEQDDAYKASLFPEAIPKIGVEAGGDDGLVQVHRAQRGGDRSGSVRGFGSGADCAGEAGLLRASRGRSGQGAAEEITMEGAGLRSRPFLLEMSMVTSEREMVRKPEEEIPATRQEERFTSLQPTYEDTVPPSADDDWDDED